MTRPIALPALAVLALRKKAPNRKRPFRTPAVSVIAPLAIIGCIGLYLNLPFVAKMVLIVWGAVGLLIYFGYSRSRSHVGRGIVEVAELAGDCRVRLIDNVDVTRSCCTCCSCSHSCWRSPMND